MVVFFLFLALCVATLVESALYLFDGSFGGSSNRAFGPVTVFCLFEFEIAAPYLHIIPIERKIAVLSVGSMLGFVDFLSKVVVLPIISLNRFLHEDFFESARHNRRTFLLELIPALSSFLHILFPFVVGVLLPFPGHHPFLEFLFPFLPHFLFPALREIHQSERIHDEVLFDVLIERGVGGEARSVVDFEDIGIEFMVQHDIKAQDFKAHVVGEVIRVHLMESSR